MSRAAAVAAAERGWSVFPCRPDDKRPAVPDWPNRACADPERVARYWPSDRHNVGIACGPSRLVVLDLDAHGELPEDWQLPGVNDGKDVLVQVCEWAGMDWPTTRTVATPSDGWHLYFAAPDSSGIRNSASLIGPQVDVRADGGYVVGAGSVTPKGTYEVLYDEPVIELPRWIARLLTPDSNESAGGQHRRSADSNASSGPGRLQGLVRTVAQAKPGSRNGALFWAGCRAAEMVSAGEADERTTARQLLDAAISAGLSEQESMRTITSAMKGNR